MTNEISVTKKDIDEIKSLRMPESIRTPGRTWTRYPDIDLEDLQNLEQIDPDIHTEGDIEVLKGQKLLKRPETSYLMLLRLMKTSLMRSMQHILTL